MGSSCSSGQAHKDKDSVSTKSEESPSYQVAVKKGNNHNVSQSEIILKPTEAGGVAQHIRLADADSMSLSSPPGTSTQSPRDVDRTEAPLPAEVQVLPANLQNALLGRVATVRVTTRARKIVIYICAADSQDCCVEKGALHNTVYPELRAWCRDRGYELHIVDLHWKTALEKQQDHEFPELCLGELARQMHNAYVIPVLFLNNSLGTPLLPNTVEKQDFEMALSKADNKDLLHKWYRLDSHAQPPCYRLQPTSKHIPGFKEDCEKEKEQALSEWRSEIERTLGVMVNVFPQELRDSYLTTVVEQEVHNTVFMSQELARRCLWLYRLYTHTGVVPEPLTPGEVELARRLEVLHRDLKTQLSEKHILRVPVRWMDGGLNVELPEHAQYVAEVTSHLTKHLKSVIDTIIEEDQSKIALKASYGISSRILYETMQHVSVCQKAAQCSVNREAILNEIKCYILGNKKGPLILHGPHGCGKTTLMARAAQCCHTWIPDALLAVRFVGISAESRTTEQLLRNIMDQVSVISQGHQYWGIQSMDQYLKEFPVLLNAAALQRPQIILIDGIDQIKEYGSSILSFLSLALPENIKLIVSVADDTKFFLSIEEKLKNNGIFMKMSTLGKEEAEAILMASVMQYNHSINSRVQDCVKASVRNCTLPLYIKVLAWQTTWWSHTEHDVAPTDNIKAQLTLMLEELESTLGKDMVEHSLALATSSKCGLTDSEMLDLLAHNPTFHSSTTYVVWAPACLFWARLNKYLAPFLQWLDVCGSHSLQWSDSTLLDIICRRYANCNSWANKTLVDYYEGKFDLECGLQARNITQVENTHFIINRRKLDELPYQVLHQKRSIKKEFLYNHIWLYNKLCGSCVHQVLEDISLEEKVCGSDENLNILRICLEESATALEYDGRQFYSQLNQKLTQIAIPENAHFIQKLLDISQDPPVLSLLSLPPLVGAEGNDGFTLVTRLGDSGDFVVTVSTEREEISVWDINSAKPVRTLKGITHPINLKTIDEKRCVVLCRRELRIYDLDSGTFVTRLKGVMNQKMPYYGLHNSEHLVALSRNRMYVNLMNLDSGDCVTTFKAGEDRFLNSLLVSGDGRVLVCGDETQKPFPLLVWNLASRKLLYDLRIPHHDFVTSLAAITHEGHYVCCVAKEVDEPCPNFIVVYDLQSGTLFKKWKPGVNTVSLDISSRDGCVLSGLEDARILVWDLVTGNCRWNLCGHTAPVTFLRLDQLGGTFLSADSQCRDRSLRLWSLSKGELIAVYTPPTAVSSCEVTRGGQCVILALKGFSKISTLHLRGPDIEPLTPAACYGNPDNMGCTFELNDPATSER